MGDSGAYAWSYNAGGGIIYWGKAFNMSAFQFARDVSACIGKSLRDSDVSEVRSKTDLESVRKRAYKQFIEIK